MVTIMPDTGNISINQICNIIELLHPCMDDYVYIYDFINDYYYISPSAISRFKLPATEFNNVVANHELFVYPSDLPDLQADLNDIISGKKEFHNMQYRWLSTKNEPVWINCRGTLVRNNNIPAYMVGCINEIGVQQKADNISGLLGLSSLQSFLSEHAEFAPKGYLIRLGLDDFKEVNEKLGNEYGNNILKKTAAAISKCLLPNQRLYRAIADEFVIIDFDGNNINTATTQYKNIREEIDKFVAASHYEAVVTISGGILPSEICEKNSFSEIMKLSEFSLNEAKRNGKNKSYLYDEKDYFKFLKQQHLTQLLRNAINNDFEGFEAYLQPLYKSDTNTLYGAEALMRFHTAEYGMVSPVEFIPLLEETGLILPAGKWMLNKSLELCREIHSIAPDFIISINISYIQVLKSNIITEIMSAIIDHEVAPATVIIELTESGLIAPDSRITKLWSCMKEKGIGLALDDFGTGYSNFQYLHDLKPDIIKIDRSFTLKAMENEYEFNLLSLIANMAHSLNLKVCVEGIENLEELNRMKEVMPDYCQGYYFGKPSPYNEFMQRHFAKCVG